MSLAVAVVRGDQTPRQHPVAGLFAHLADRGLGGRLPDVGPATGRRPAAVVGLSYEQDLPFAEDRRTNVYLRGRGAGF